MHPRKIKRSTFGVLDELFHTFPSHLTGSLFSFTGSAFIVRDAEANKGGQSFGAKFSEAKQQKLVERPKNGN